MIDMDDVIAWLADTELYYREYGKTEDDLHQSKMANDAIILIKKLKEENLKSYEHGYRNGKRDEHISILKAIQRTVEQE